MTDIRRLLIVLWFVCVPASAAEDRAFFWKVSSEQTSVYLLGSIHFANASFYPLRDVILEAFDDADRMSVEVVLDETAPQEYTSLLDRYGRYPRGETLRDHVSESTYQRLLTFLEGSGMPATSMDSLRPGIIVMQLASMMMMQNGYTPGYGIDMRLMARARASGKPIDALETIEQQIRLIAGLPHHDMVLAETLDQLDEAASMIDEMERAWKVGDDAAMLALLITDPEGQYAGFEDVNEILLYQRNRGMLEKISGYLKGDEQRFIVVGAAHLIGTEGLIELLDEAGYEIERL